MLFGLALFSAAAAHACSCLPPAPAVEELKRSRAVFIGRVIEIKRRKETDDLFRSVEVVFEVTKVWKGIAARNITVYTSPDSAACGFNFKKGESYLVYASGTDDDRLHASICSRTARLKNARKDLQLIGPGGRRAHQILPRNCGTTRRSVVRRRA